VTELSRRSLTDWWRTCGRDLMSNARAGDLLNEAEMRR
jgi:hypothetical protein